MLSDCKEKIFSQDEPTEIVQLGGYLIRGDTIAIIGEVDEEIEANTDYEAMRCVPIKPLK